MKKIIFGLGILISTVIKAQDPHFSQVFMQGMYLNPALAGDVLGWKTNAQHRRQWPELGLISTTNIGVEKQLTRFKTGLGLTILNDVQPDGISASTSAGLNYSRWFSLTETIKLSAGARMELVSKSLDFSRLTFGDDIDPALGFDEPITGTETIPGTINFVNVSIGSNLKANDFDFGFAVTNIFEPNQSFSTGYIPVPRNIRLYGTYSIHVNESNTISPLVYFYGYSESQTTISGLNYKFKFLNTFLGYRYKDAMLYGVGVDFKRLKIQYSFDQTVSTLKGTTGGSHEFGLVFRFGSKEGYDDGGFIF